MNGLSRTHLLCAPKTSDFAGGNLVSVLNVISRVAGTTNIDHCTLWGITARNLRNEYGRFLDCMS